MRWSASGSKRRPRLGILLAATAASAALYGTTMGSIPEKTERLDMPWRDAGWSERQAAAHLLDRLAFGARPGDVDRVVAMGLDRWVITQLRGDLRDSRVDRLLRGRESLGLSAREIAETYPNPGTVFRRAVEAGIIENPRVDDPDPQKDPKARQAVYTWARKQGVRPMREALYDLVIQKLARATYSENQLTEVLTDFWFNHFNVSIDDTQARIYLWPYERDAIRPYVTGRFRDMLGATAAHPAMLHYLDNVRSVADGEAKTTVDARLNDRRQRRKSRRPDRERRRSQGLNENYARELMELHTLGVDGGYGQKDVVEVARAFTGWSTYPAEASRRDLSRRIARAKRFPGAGFVFDESFIFRADVHDAGEKVVLGRRLSAGRGVEDGLDVLDLLAAHPSTARHLARKFAVRFVVDDPPQALVDRLATSFERSGGDLGELVVTVVESPEFWAPETRQAKIKSPFEVVISSLRITGAEARDPRGIYDWIRRMGQPLYGYQAPTGYPDRASAWVNTGALLHRMNFGLQLATGQVPGVEVDLLSLAAERREPASLDEALELYLPVLLPERDVVASMERLRHVIRDPDLVRKIAEAAPRVSPGSDDPPWDADAGGERWNRRPPPVPASAIDHGPVAQVVGVILGSPEFQRR